MTRVLGAMMALGLITTLSAQDGTRDKKDGPRAATEAGSKRKTDAGTEGGSKTGTEGVLTGKITKTTVVTMVPCV